MAEKTLYKASPDWLGKAVEILVANGVDVIAPVETEGGLVDLHTVRSGQGVTLDYGKVKLPLKRLFFPPTESLLRYADKEAGDVEVAPEPLPGDGPVVVFGARPCEVAGLRVLDEVFQWDYDDVRYRARRERTTIAAFACTAPGPECFCTSVGGSPHGRELADVLVYPCDGGEALVEPLTQKGQALVEQLSDVLADAPADAKLPQPPDVPKKFDPQKIKAWLDDNFDSEFWAETALKCLGCGACSYLCPTCHCFDIVDEAVWNRGRRRRNWDCCAYAQFTRHASGHNPRPERSARCRQRVMHKFKYFPERFAVLACVGCGRCTLACGVGRNITQVMAEIESRADATEPTGAER